MQRLRAPNLAEKTQFLRRNQRTLGTDCKANATRKPEYVDQGTYSRPQPPAQVAGFDSGPIDPRISL